MDSRHNWSKPATVLEQPYHLSYPFLFDWKGELLMIPETSGNGTIEIYRCVRFPFEWTLEHVVLEDVQALDSTIAQINSGWWMFTTLVSSGSQNKDELFLLHAADPLGKWAFHRMNPIRSDVRNSRSGGRIFSFKGHLYRHAQNCARSYGASLHLNRILEIDRSTYREESVAHIVPEWEPHLLGLHTLNACQGLSLIDLKLRRRKSFG
jgi:hypothetical protein